MYDKPSASVIAALARALMSTPEYLLQGKGSEKELRQLSKDEQTLLDVFKVLDPRDRQLLLADAQKYLNAPATPGKHR